MLHQIWWAMVIAHFMIWQMRNGSPLSFPFTFSFSFHYVAGEKYAVCCRLVLALYCISLADRCKAWCWLKFAASQKRAWCMCFCVWLCDRREAPCLRSVRRELCPVGDLEGAHAEAHRYKALPVPVVWVWVLLLHSSQPTPAQRQVFQKAVWDRVTDSQPSWNTPELLKHMPHVTLGLLARHICSALYLDSIMPMS